MIDYNYKVRNGQNKSWEDKSSPRQRTRIFLQKTREDLEMIEFIISILVPILGGLGVSEADVTTYVTNCSGYIYAILISILVLIVLLVAAHFIAPKGKRHLVRWGASLALVTMVNMVCYGPLYTNLSVVLNGGGTVSDEAKAASNEVIKKVGEGRYGSCKE